jgi:hypothetical protein
MLVGPICIGRPVRHNAVEIDATGSHWHAVMNAPGLLSVFYVEGCLSFSLPAVHTGSFIPVFGLTNTANMYGAMIILIASVRALIASGNKQ